MEVVTKRGGGVRLKTEDVSERPVTETVDQKFRRILMDMGQDPGPEQPEARQ